MSDKKLIAKIVLVKEPIVKRTSTFVGKKNTQGPKKIVTNKDCYKRQ
jgi:hypothetical protein